MSDPVLSQALLSIARHAESARSSLSRVPLVNCSPEETAARLSVAAGDLAQLRGSMLGALSYHALSPLALPAVPGHIPEFMRTRPEPSQDEAAAAALAYAQSMPTAGAGQGEGASAPAPSAAVATHAFSSAARQLASDYARSSAEALVRIAGLTAPGEGGARWSKGR